MKKTMMFLALSGLLMVSCGPKAEAPVEETVATEVVTEECCTEEAAPLFTEEEQSILDRYANIETLATDEEKTAVIAEVKAMLDAKKAACKAECGEAKEACEAEMTEECKAKKAEFEAAWATFETLDMAAQKQMIDHVICHINKQTAKCDGEKACCGEGKEGCCETAEEAPAAE